MRIRLYNILFFIIIFICIVPYIIFAQTEKPYYDNIVILKTKTIKSKCKDLENYLLNFQNFSLSNEFPIKSTTKKMSFISNIYRLEFFNKTDITKIIKELSLLSEIEYAEPLYKIYPLYSVNDSYAQTDQYWINLISADLAWDICKGDTNIVIGISDTGIDFTHEDLIGQIKYNYNDPIDGIDNDNDGYIDNFRGWDFGDNDNDPQSETNQHGITVSGIAAAQTDNMIGIAGAGFKCLFMPIKIANSNDNLVNAYQSILYAAEQGCSVVNCSWGSEFYQQMGQDVINYVSKNYDILVVASAGNTATETQFYPASYENVLSVTGVFSEDNIWLASSPNNGGSTYSYTVDIAAPCGHFITTYNGNTYGTAYRGTSFAAPIVSGCAGILRSYFPNYNARQIEELIRISTDNIDTIQVNSQFAEKMGSGRINLYKALTMQQTPSVRFHNQNILYNVNNEVIVNGIFTNYLANAKNLTITAKLHSDNATLANNSIFSGNLESLENYISENNIVINVSENTPTGEIAILELIYSADNYLAKQKIYVKIKKEYIDIVTDIMTLSVTGKGRIAFNDLNSKNGNGLNYNGFDILSECSIIAGNSENNIYTSSQQISDFKTNTFPIKIADEEYHFFDDNIYVDFDDSYDSLTLGINYLQNVYAKKGEKYKNFYIIDYKLINTTNSDINNFYFGLFSDWDLANSANNSTLFNSQNNFMYCKYENEENIYAGIKLLTKQFVNNYSFPIYENENNINITDGFSDNEKFTVISTPFSNNNTQNTDIVISTSAGPFNISANDTTNIAFAIISANNFDNLINSSNFAQILYNSLNNKNKNNNKNSTDIIIIPSVADNYIEIFFNNNLDIDSKLDVINAQGKIVMSSDFFKYQNINITTLNAGIYTVRINDSNNNFYSKFIKK